MGRGAGRELAVLRVSEALGGKYNAMFSPDSSQIVAWGGDNPILRFYLTHIEDLMALARTRVTRELMCAERVKYLHETVTCP